MKHILNMKMRSSEDFKDVEVIREIDYTLFRDGEEVEMKESNLEDIKEQYGTLGGATVLKAEVYMNYDGNKVYRLMSQKGDQTFYYYIEKIF